MFTKRLLTAAVLCLAPALAHAQSARMPACWPSQVGGSGTAAQVRSNEGARAVAWVCTTDFTQTLEWFAGRNSDFFLDWMQKAAEIVAGGPVGMAASWAELVKRVFPLSEAGRLPVFG